MKQIFLFISLLLVPLAVNAQEKVTIDGLMYYLFDGNHTAKIENSNSWTGELDIPETVTYNGEEYTVVAMDWLAFDNCKTLTKVRIPKSILFITHYAGYDDCKNPFRGCSNLEAIEVDEDNPTMCSVDGVLYNKGKTKLYCYPTGKKQKSYAVPEGVTWIGGDAMAYNRYLETVTIPNSVTKMCFGTFSNCANLKSVKLSEHLTNIGSSTFEKCTSLKFLDIPESVTYFEESVFRWSPIDTIVIRGTFPNGLRSDTFYFMDESTVIYVQQSEVDKFKKVFSGKVLPLELFPGHTEQPQTNNDEPQTGDPLYFEIEKIDPSAGIPPVMKNPPLAPTVLVNGNVLEFQSEHPAYTLNIVDNEGNTLYTTEIPESMMQVELPFNLTKDMEVNLLQGSWRIYGRLEPDYETVKVNGINNHPDSPSAPVYDLQGRRIQGEPAKKGVYVRGGKKYVKK